MKITQDVFDQIVRYNMALRARYLIVSNGLNHYCCKIDYEQDTYHFLPKIPDYADICQPFSENSQAGMFDLKVSYKKNFR